MHVAIMTLEFGGSFQRLVGLKGRILKLVIFCSLWQVISCVVSSSGCYFL